MSFNKFPKIGEKKCENQRKIRNFPSIFTGKNQWVEKSFPFTNTRMKTIINKSISIKIERARTLPCTVLVEKWLAVGLSPVSEKKSLVKDVAVGQ